MAILALIRNLTAARPASPALQRGAFEVLHDARDLLIYSREHGERRAYVIMNTAKTTQIAVLDTLKPGQSREALSGQLLAVHAGSVREVAARGALVLTAR